MACYSPIRGERLEDGRVVHVPRAGDVATEAVTVACGQCRGCRLETSRIKAVRALHESKMHEANCFLTLTYDDSNLPEHGTLVKDDVRNFIKRMRERERYNANKEGREPKKIRHAYCGEYGDRYGRPHYHLLIFGEDWAHDRQVEEIKNEHPLYTSETVSSLWKEGIHRIGELTFESAAYVARYVMKKINGPMAEEHYAVTWNVDEETGEVTPGITKEPEFWACSTKPGLGKDFYEKYKEEIYRDDFVLMNGKKLKPPKYYDGKYELEQPERMQDLKDQREAKGEKHKKNNTADRLRTREKIQEAKLKQLKREIE